jgi:hypothetical protein
VSAFRGTDHVPEEGIQMLLKNQQGVERILEIIRPRVIGRESSGFSCNCGAIHCPAATATSIEPAGDKYPGQEVLWFLWLVYMTPKKGHRGASWACGLSEFIPAEELDALFAEYFPGRSE